jgi:hypothetical protein
VTVRLTTAIMVHPRRLDSANNLARMIPSLNPKVVVDPNPTGRTLETSRLAWATVEDDSTHHMVLQDDITTCQNFATQVKRVIADLPNFALSLFTNWGSRSGSAGRIAILRGHEWVELADYYLPSLATVLPASHARAFAAGPEVANHDDWALEPSGQVAGNDDWALFDYVEAAAVKTYIHVPDLVEHGELPSLHNSENIYRRLATCYRHDFTEAQFGRGVDRPLMIVPHFSWTKRKNHWVARPAADAKRWYSVAANDILEFCRCSTKAIEAEYHRASRALPTIDNTEVRSSLWDVWLTSVGIGLAVVSAEDGADIMSAPAQMALSTIAPGAWRVMAEDSLIDRIRPDMLEFVTHGVRVGIDQVEDGATPFDGAILPKEFFDRINLVTNRWP